MLGVPDPSLSTAEGPQGNLTFFALAIHANGTRVRQHASAGH